MFKLIVVLGSVMILLAPRYGYSADMCVPSECGYNKTWNTVATGFATITGATTGGVIASVLGPNAAIAGTAAGAAIGYSLGGKLQLDTADEYLKLSTGQCLECDTCEIPPCNDCGGGKYVTNGDRVFRCVAGLFDDKWVDVTEQMGFCNDSPIKNKKAKNAVLDYRLDSQNSFDKAGVRTGDSFCYTLSCPSGTKYDSSKNECIKKDIPHETKFCTDKKGSKVADGKRGEINCEKSQVGAVKCDALCDKGIWGDKQIVNCDTTTYKPKPENGKCVKKDGPHEPKSCVDKNGINVANGQRGEIKCESSHVGAVKCSAVCNDGIWINKRIDECDTKTYNKTPQENQCVKKDNGGGNVVEPVECPQIPDRVEGCPEANKMLENLRQICRDNPENGIMVFEHYRSLIREEITKCKSQQNASDLKKRIGDLASRISIDDWRKSLTVWKTKEGDFNKARLASDSIAGVVLGTAGGLITSKVVKKSQVKSGFEDVQCTIGGQKVADWGDEFTVGIQ